MKYNFLEDLDIKGHLEITKCYRNGDKEVVFDDHNIIVSGMGLGLAQMFSLSGPPTIVDYQIDRFQVGVSGSPAREVTTTNQLAGPLSSINEYGTQARILIVSGNHAKTLSTYAENQVFGYIPQHKVSRIGPNSVRYTLTLDEESGNEVSRNGETLALNEVGLFMKNPLGDRFSLGEDTSVLVAYRYFSPIAKTTDFSLVFRWTLSF